MSGQYICMADVQDYRYDPHDTIMLFYDVGVNSFIDTYGNVILDIHRLLAPWQLMLFKRYMEDCVFPDVTNSFLIELVYPDDIYERTMCLDDEPVYNYRERNRRFL